MNTYKITFFLSGLIISMAVGLGIDFLTGCASLAPGADPLVVRVEQTETGAKATLDLIVNEDDANRAFWLTNAPAFHQFAEKLRAPVSIDGTTLPFGYAAIRSLDDIKVSYKAGAATSNTVETVLATLQGVLSQASAWSTIVSNAPTH